MNMKHQDLLVAVSHAIIAHDASLMMTLTKLLGLLPDRDIVKLWSEVSAILKPHEINWYRNHLSDHA